MKNTILNATQHPATPEQIAAGVRDMVPALSDDLRKQLTFDDLPTSAQIVERARQLALFIAFNFETVERVMIGGAPFLMGPLEVELRSVGKRPMYAFSRRESVEEAQEDGSVRKLNVFRHCGFVVGAAI